MQTGAATMEKSMEVPLKTKNRATIWSCNPTPGRVSGENNGSKGNMYPSVHCTTVYNSQDKDTTQMSVDRWMDKIQYDKKKLSWGQRTWWIDFSLPGGMDDNNS